MTTQAKPLTEHTVTFDAMGTQVLVIVASEAGLHEVAQAIDDVRSLFTREEARFTRFTRESELSRMNANGGTFNAMSELGYCPQGAVNGIGMAAGSNNVGIQEF